MNMIETKLAGRSAGDKQLGDANFADPSLAQSNSGPATVDERGLAHGFVPLGDSTSEPVGSSEHQAFGVSKPIGWVMASFAEEADRDEAAKRLQQAGFDGAAQVRFSAEEMVRKADTEIAHASVLAAIGQELNLVKAQRELALQGHCFLGVQAPGDDDTEQVAEVMRACGATRAQKYGTWIIEDLVDVGSDPRQVGESASRGLDSQTLTSREGDR